MFLSNGTVQTPAKEPFFPLTWHLWEGAWQISLEIHGGLQSFGLDGAAILAKGWGDVGIEFVGQNKLKLHAVPCKWCRGVDLVGLRRA